MELKTRRKVSIIVLIFTMAIIVLCCLFFCRKSQQIDMEEHPELIAHAGGAIYGYRLSNSLEAINNAYDVGFRYLELDFEMTSDGYVVLIHDWESMSSRMLFSEGQRSLEEFKNSDTFMDLTVLTLDDLLNWLKKHPDVSVITDVKSEDNLKVLSSIRDVSGELIERFIPQIYEYKEYDSVLQMGYERIILTLYRMNPDTEELRNFVMAHDIWAVTMSDARITDELLTAITSTGTAVYCHAVNDLSFFEGWKKKGLTGIYTDYFTPEKWPEN